MEEAKDAGRVLRRVYVHMSNLATREWESEQAKAGSLLGLQDKERWPVCERERERKWG